MRADNDQSEVRIAVVSPPGEEPVTLAELKLHARVDLTDDDELLSALITAAREWVESHTGRRLMQRTETLFLDGFPDSDRIAIPVAPVAAIGAVTYLDDAGASTTLDSSAYVTDVNGPIGVVALKTGQTWPALTSSKRPVNAVRVAFTSGYATAALVPSSLKLVVKMLAAHFYENREGTTPITVNEVPFGIRALLRPWRVPEVLT
jgi:uncharacterized phiE125 gp8 family phage protein